MKIILTVMALFLSLCFINISHAAPSGCTITITPVSFGTYNPFSPDAVTNSNGRIKLAGCSSKHTVTVTLSQGDSGSFDPREMSGPNNSKLEYNLYRNSAMTRIWGNGSGNTRVFTKKNTKKFNRRIYAKLFPGQTAAHVGSYTDTITATFNFS